MGCEKFIMDVAQAGMLPLRHFTTQGQAEGRDPVPVMTAAAPQRMAPPAEIGLQIPVDSAESQARDADMRARVAAMRQQRKDEVEVGPPPRLRSATPADDISILEFPEAARPRVSILIPVYNELDVDGELAARGLLPAAIAIASKLWPTTVRVAARTLDAVLGALAGAGAGRGVEVAERQRRGGGDGNGDGWNGEEGEQAAAPAPAFTRSSSAFSEGGSGGASMRQRRPVGAVEMTPAGAGAANGH